MEAGVILTTPVMPLATVKNQKRPCALPCAPCAAVASVAPRTMRSVVATSAALRPILSHRRPTETWPRTAPGKGRGQRVPRCREQTLWAGPTLTYEQCVGHTGRHDRRVIFGIELFEHDLRDRAGSHCGVRRKCVTGAR